MEPGELLQGWEKVVTGIEETEEQLSPVVGRELLKNDGRWQVKRRAESGYWQLQVVAQYLEFPRPH